MQTVQPLLKLFKFVMVNTVYSDIQIFKLLTVLEQLLLAFRPYCSFNYHCLILKQMPHDTFLTFTTLTVNSATEICFFFFLFFTRNKAQKDNMLEESEPTFLNKKISLTFLMWVIKK